MIYRRLDEDGNFGEDSCRTEEGVNGQTRGNAFTGTEMCEFCL